MPDSPIVKNHSLALALSLLLAAGSSQAANFRWLENTPARHFVDSDWEMLRTTADKVLNEGKIGEETSWENPETGTSGSLKPVANGRGEKAHCRRLELTNRARGLTNTSVMTLCREAETGEWRIER